MTFIALVALDDCAIIAADSAVFSVRGTSSHMAGASCSKITIAGSGYITASGLVELVQPVKNRFGLEAPASVGAMVSIIEQEVDAFRRRHRSQEAKYWIDRSSWQLSFLQKDAVVAAYWDRAAGALRGVMPVRTVFTFPNDVTDAQMRRSEEMAAEIQKGQSCPDGVARAMVVILRVVESLRAQGASVSSGIDFALLHKSWRHQVSSEQFCAQGFRLVE